ncbi:HEAT repeat domain-containing protein [Aliihoeflea sp. PC F10.4]
MERLQLVDLLPAISRRLPFEASLSVRSASVRVLAALGDTIALEEMQIYLDRDEPEMTRGTLVGLLRSGEVEAIVAAAEKLGVLVGSADAKERELAARVLEEAGVAGLYRPVAKLMGDENADVRNAAITAAGALGHHRLWPDILSHLGDSLAHASASRSLRQAGAAAVPLLVRSLATEEREEVQVRLANLCGALADARLIAPLQSMLVRSTEPALRTAILEALAACGHRILDQEAHDWVLREVAEATWVLAGFCEIAEQSDLRPVRLALEAEIERRKSHIFTVLSMRHDAGLVHKLRDGLRDASMEQRAYALELLDVMVSSTLKPLLVALLDDFSHQQRFRRLNRRFPQTQLSPTDRLRAIIEAPPTYVRPWTRSCAIYAAGQSEEKSFTETLARAGQMRDPMVRETASWAVRRIGAASGRELETPKIGEPLTR